MSKHSAVVLTLLLTVHAAMLAYGASLHSPDWNEVGHMVAGLSHWEFARFDLYRVNPPLVRMVAVFPVLFTDHSVDWSLYSESIHRRPEFEIGQLFLQWNGMRSYHLFMLARLACIPFSLLGAWLCYRWANVLYGRGSGLLPAALWCSSPLVLGFAQTIMPDIGATAVGLGANYCFWLWHMQPNSRRSIGLGAVLGMALLTKTIWLILFVLWPVILLLDRFVWTRKSCDITIWNLALQLSLAFVVALNVVNLAYLFEGSFRPLKAYEFVSETLGGDQVTHNRFAGSWVAAVPVPLPRNYVQGIDVQKHDFELGGWSYLRGEWRYGGWWYYYIYGLLLKMPLGVWLLLTLAVTSRSGARGECAFRDELFLVLPGAAILVLVSSQTGFNHHVRYVLPAVPSILILTARLGNTTSIGGVRRGIAVGALAWTIVSSFTVWPHSLSYFNELAGGPTNGHAHMGGSPSDTNVDCGQDVLLLRDWIAAHPESRGIRVAVTGVVSPRDLGLGNAVPPPRFITQQHDGNQIQTCQHDVGPARGWYAVSVNRLHSRAGEYSYFLKFRPVGRVGYSINIYHLDQSDVEWFRQNGLDSRGEAER